MTEAERTLWAAVRGHALGVHVRRQHPMLGWIVDFYVASAGLVIELDGGVHEGQAEADAHRTATLARAGFRVLRVDNDEVLSALPAVCAKIVAALAPPG